MVFKRPSCAFFPVALCNMVASLTSLGTFWVSECLGDPDQCLGEQRPTRYICMKKKETSLFDATKCRGLCVSANTAWPHLTD